MKLEELKNKLIDARKKYIELYRAHAPKEILDMWGDMCIYLRREYDEEAKR